MVRGAAAGAGLSMALACDLRVAGESARFATAFARSATRGLRRLLVPHAGVGTAKARELYYTRRSSTRGRPGARSRQPRRGDDKLEEETLTLARRLAQGPRIALRYMKRNMNAAETQTLAQCLDLEAMHHTRTGFTEDHKEAARAFVEKREPVFRGR